MTTLHIRTLTADDWAVWRNVRLRALADAPEAFGSTLADWTGEHDREDRWRSRFATVELNAVAVIDDLPVGAVGGLRGANTSEAELISMWVDPAVRGTGVGLALIGAVVDWAHAVQVGHLTLAVRRQNRRAVALSGRAGFRFSAPNPTDGAEDLMTLDLTGTAGSSVRVGSAR